MMGNWASKNVKPSNEAEYGIEVLYDSDNASGETGIDIVFIHGLSGNRRSTWTQDGVLWPHDLLPTSFPGARIITAGYSGDIEVQDIDSELKRKTMKRHAIDVCKALVDLREATSTRFRPVILVGHSIGGFTCAEIMLVVSDANVKSISRETRGFIFFATPFDTAFHLEQDILPMIVSTVPNGQDKTIRNLHKKCKELEKVIITFLAQIPTSTAIRNFFEDPSNRSVIVGRAWIEDVCKPLQESFAIPANHNNICKFQNDGDAGYILVVQAIRKFKEKDHDLAIISHALELPVTRKSFQIGPLAAERSYESRSYESPSYQSPSYQSPSYESPSYQSSSYQSPSYQSPSYGPVAYAPASYGEDDVGSNTAVLIRASSIVSEYPPGRPPPRGVKS